MTDPKHTIKSGRAVLGIEFGSTRIKAVLIDEHNAPIAQGAHEWENRYEGKIWTYSIDDIWNGLQDCYADLRKNVKEQYDEEITELAGIGISAMMHGYLAFDSSDRLLVPFRTWRNTNTGAAAEKLTAGVTDDILVMNRCDEQIAKKHRLCRGNVYFIPGMGVDFSRFPPAAPEERAAAKAAYFLPEDAVCLVCAAEFSKRKNQTLLLQTLARLPENYYLLLPGDGALLQECKAEAETLGISSRSRFPGRISDVRGALAAADICVSASRSEGLPFAVMEAMHTALPCVLTRVKGHEDLLEGSGAGYLVPFGDAAAFAEAVQTLGRDAALRARMGAAANESTEKYALDRVLPEVLPHFTRH